MFCTGLDPLQEEKQTLTKKATHIFAIIQFPPVPWI